MSVKVDVPLNILLLPAEKTTLSPLLSKDSNIVSTFTVLVLTAEAPAVFVAVDNNTEPFLAPTRPNLSITQLVATDA